MIILVTVWIMIPEIRNTNNQYRSVICSMYGGREFVLIWVVESLLRKFQRITQILLDLLIIFLTTWKNENLL